MKKATKRTVNYLSQLVGHKVIRTKPTTVTGDWSYTTTPIILKGFSDKGEVIFQYAEGTFESRIFESRERTLPLEFTDQNWKLYSMVENLQDSELNKWRGRKICRTTPTKILGDSSYTDTPVKLISASKYHLIIESSSGKRILNYDYANPKEWVLAE